METSKIYFGVDVGSESLVISSGIANSSDKFIKLATQSVANTVESINQWIETLPQNAHVIHETTGTYSLNLSYCLELAEISFSIITPNQSKGFALSMKVSNQNDAIDASLLAIFGANNRPQRTILEDENLHHLKQKRKHLSSLMAQKQVINNQLHAISFDFKADKTVLESLKLLQTTFSIQIEQFKKELYSLNEQQYKQIYELMTSVVGIGDASANAMIIAADGFTNFENVKQVLKFFGIIPCEKESSKTVRKKYGLAKTGASYVRSVLYMAARAAKKHNLACIEIYKKQRNLGKPHKVTMVAVMNKLVRQVFGVVKTQTVFVNNYEFAK